MDSSRDSVIVVGLGDCHVARPPVRFLSTYALGSCIAVVTWDWKSRAGGLLHIMLPDSGIDPGRARTNPFVYADTGVPAMLRQLEEKGAVRRRLRWCLAGGAQMTGGPSHFEIGKRNHTALRRVFRELGLSVEREDVGGVESRSVQLSLETGRIDLRTGTARERVLLEASMLQIGAGQAGGGDRAGFVSARL